MIFGRRDPAFTPDIPQLMNKHVENYTLHYVEGANHFVQQDAPGEVNKCIRDFLADHTADR